MSIRSENISKIPIDEVINRLMEATKSKNISQLAAALDTKQGVVSNWKRRGTIPWNVIFEHFDLPKSIYIVFGIDISEKLQNEIETSKRTEQDSPSKDQQHQMEELRQKLARAESALDAYKEMNAQLLKTITELSKLDGTPSRETATH